MTTRAYVLIETSVGKTREVVSSLRGVENIVSVDAVTGPYDVIAVVEAGDLNLIGDLITKTVHAASGVTRTVTCLAVRVD